AYEAQLPCFAFGLRKCRSEARQMPHLGSKAFTRLEPAVLGEPSAQIDDAAALELAERQPDGLATAGFPKFGNDDRLGECWRSVGDMAPVLRRAGRMGQRLHRSPSCDPRCSI